MKGHDGWRECVRARVSECARVSVCLSVRGERDLREQIRQMQSAKQTSDIRVCPDHDLGQSLIFPWPADIRHVLSCSLNSLTDFLFLDPPFSLQALFSMSFKLLNGTTNFRGFWCINLHWMMNPIGKKTELILFRVRIAHRAERDTHTVESLLTNNNR